MIRLLLASDYAVTRAGMRAILASSDDLQLAGEGRSSDVLAQAVDLRPDVVLLELPMGEQGSLETLWRLLSELPELGVVVITDDASESAAREALQAGARGYLLRDVSSEEILSAVRAVHQGLTVLHPATSRSLLRRDVRQPLTVESDPLTERELEVLQLLAQGLPSKTIGHRLGISEHTVKFHVGSILGKLGAASRTEAVSVALRRGLISL